MNKKQTILVVDDIKENIDVLVGILNKYDIITALDGTTAIDILKDENVDLILLDIMMPQMDGFEVCQTLKKDSRTKNTPIIFLTGKDSQEDLKKGFELGAVDYISKPFEPNELMVRVNTHLELGAYQRDLEKKIESEILKNKQNQDIFYQQSKQAALGELLMHVAHQWKQPLSELSAINTLLITKANLETDMDSKTQMDIYHRTQKVITFMSNTLDTFKNFYQPTDTRDYFFIKESLENILSIVGATFNYANIEVSISSNETDEIFANKNELEQALLSILNNARSIFSQRGIKEPKIDIEINNYEISIKDNAGGIEDTIYDDIFKPHKSGRNSSGMGLSIAQSIINKNNGFISACNLDDGANFVIKFEQEV